MFIFGKRKPVVFALGGTAYVISKLAYGLHIDCSLICITPFSFEGKKLQKSSKYSVRNFSLQ